VDIPDRLRALTLNGGEAWLWEEDEPQSGPVIGADGLIYFLGGDELSGPRVLYAVNSDGVTERTVSLGPGGLLEWGFANVVLRETDNGVEAFTASTDTLFRVLPDDTVRSGSVPPTSRKTLGGYEGDLWGLALDEGRNMLYVSHSTGEIMAFDADTLAHKWTCTLPGLVGSIPAIGDDAIYIGQCDDSHYDPMTNRSRAVHHHGVCAIDHSGNLKWTTPMPGEIRASLAVDGRGDVYAAVREEPRADGLVYSIKPDGSVRWRIALPHHEWAISAPAVGHDNRVYVFNESLWAIGEAGGSSGGTRDDTSNDGSADDPRGGDGDGAGGRAADW
jgi:outer membrane protein assembly factor BamB